MHRLPAVARLVERHGVCAASSRQSCLGGLKGVLCVHEGASESWREGRVWMCSREDEPRTQSSTTVSQRWVRGGIRHVARTF